MDQGVSRRQFARAVGGAAAVGAATGPASAQEEEPDFGYISGANGGSVEDARGESAVTVEVGAGSEGLAFAPTGLWVDPGTTVTFEWTGEGGGHNVMVEETPEESDWGGYETVEDEGGFTYEHTFEVEGVYEYYCQPHQQLNMLGAIGVGDDIPTVEVGGGGGPPVIGDGVKTLVVATMAAFGTTLSLAYVFLRYGGSPPSGAES